MPNPSPSLSVFRRAAFLIALTLAFVSCATPFSPDLIRQEIVTQQGADPLSAFELDLGRFTTQLIKTVLADENGDAPFSGLGSLQLAVYEAPSDDGPAIDVTRIEVVGWEQVLRLSDEKRSGMVLIQPRGERIGDLVVVGAGARQVIYARLGGDLDPSLPETLGDLLRTGGPEEVRRVLAQLGE